MSSDVPAPKKPPTCPITFDAAATNNATPSEPKMKTRDMRKMIEDLGSRIEDRLARNDATLDPRSSILDPRSSIDPDNRLRGDDSLNDLSVHQTQPSVASAMPSRKNSERTCLTENPMARRSPISRSRCSTPSLKKSAVSSNAET